MADSADTHRAVTVELKERVAAAEQSSGENLERALELARQMPRVANAEVAMLLNAVGALLRRASRIQDAHSVYVQALEIAEEALGPDHADLAGIYRNLAELELARGRFVTGESYARRSMEIREAAPGTNHAAIAEDAMTLAALLEGQGRLVEARRLRDGDSSGSDGT